METLKYIVVGVVGAVLFTFLVIDAIDTEVARNDYNENVEQCKKVEGCIFGWNCRKYNKMIQEVCDE